MRKYAFAVTVVLAVGTALPLSAQISSPREGTYFAFGLGAGVTNIDKCANCGSEGTSTSFTGFFRLGGTMAPQWLAAVEVGAWYQSRGGYTAGLLSVAGIGTFYPLSNGLKINGGIGGMVFREAFAPNDNTANGVIYRVGAGYDISLNEVVSISPFVDLVYGPDLDQKRNRLATFNDMKLVLVQIGVSLVRH
ncbi:MAG: hypothetical protein IH876_04265 [Gemmatimonadetes bacterium]|nr:hypothetical protein [Gemmatimonadota bacterium]